jgi:hypothetical protein
MSGLLRSFYPLLAIMGVRLRVGHLSCSRAHKHEYFSGVARTADLIAAFPITLVWRSRRITWASSPSLSSHRASCYDVLHTQPAAIGAIDIIACHQRPCDPRHLVGQRDAGETGRSAL